VTSPNDSGPGTLRQAILDANAHPGLDQIDFSVATTDRVLINFLSPLVITSPLILDGAPQAVGRPEPPVILDRFTGTGDGLVLDSGADGSEIRNLEIRSVSGSDFAAIRLPGASGVHVSGIVVGGVGDNVVVKNLVSNNGTGIVVVEGFNQLIQGNIIGTNPEITRAVPNGIGISILNITDVADLRVGGAIAGEGNRICGNT